MEDHPVNDMSRPSLTGRTAVLRPVTPDDYPSIYHWSTTPPTAETWRFRGATPSPDAFAATLFDGVLAQYVVATRSNPAKPAGLVQAFNYDPANRLAYLGAL